MFFDQIKEIDSNIKQLRDDMKRIGSSAEAHFDQLDDIAAHIIAVEAILSVVLKANGVDKADVMAWIKENTESGSGGSEGSEKVRIVAEQFLAA